MKTVFLAIIWKALIFTLLSSFSFKAYSAITINNITGASNIVGFGINDNNALQVFAGAYGNESDCSGKGANEFCDTCTGTTQQCNTTRVHNNMALYITFTSDTKAGFPFAYLKQDVNKEIDLIDPNLELQNIAAGTPVTLAISWGELCNEFADGTISGQTDCTFNGDTILGFGIRELSSTSFDDGANDTSELTRILIQGTTVGLTTVHANPTQNYCQTAAHIADTTMYSGACNFTAFPGDEKVFIEDVVVHSGFPSLGTDVNVNAIRIYYAESGFGSITPTQFADLEVGLTSSNNRATMESNTIEGLKNNTKYYFRLATVDQAKNVTYFTGFNNDDATCVDGAEINPCHEATPESVIGLLEDDLDCFIATASFGSPFEKHVSDLRAFRTRYLHNSYLGRKLIQFYYQNSPPVAKWISQNPSVKPIVRMLLWPFWFFAKLCLQYGHFVFLGLFGFLLSLIGFRFARLKTRRVG